MSTGEHVVLLPPRAEAGSAYSLETRRSPMLWALSCRQVGKSVNQQDQSIRNRQDKNLPKDAEQLKSDDGLVASVLDVNQLFFHRPPSLTLAHASGMVPMRPSAYCVSEEARGTRANFRALRAGNCTNPVNPVSMTASKKSDGPEGADTAMVIKGVLLLSSEPRSVAIRQATRPERRSLADADEVIRTFCALSGCLAISSPGRLCYVYPLRSNIDQDVLTWISTLEVGPMPLVQLAANSGDLPRIEAHQMFRRPDSTQQPRSSQRVPEETV